MIEHYSEAKYTPMPRRRLLDILGMVGSSGSPPKARFAHINNLVRRSWYDTLPPYLFRIGRRHVEKSALPYISIPESGWNLLAKVQIVVLLYDQGRVVDIFLRSR